MNLLSAKFATCAVFVAAMVGCSEPTQSGNTPYSPTNEKPAAPPGDNPPNVDPVNPQQPVKDSVDQPTQGGDDSTPKAQLSLNRESITGRILRGVDYKFDGEASSDIRSVNFEVDGWPLGNADVNEGLFSLTYSFTSAKEDRLLVVVGIGSDASVIVRKEYRITVYEPIPQPVGYEAMAAEIGVKLDPLGIFLEGYKQLGHTKSVEVDKAMSEEEGRKLFFDGIYPQAKSKTDFLSAVALGVIPRYGNAQCAVTTSSVIEHAALRVRFQNVAAIFNKARREAPGDLLSCTDEVETELRKLGWNYFYKKDYVVPTSAIALMGGRYSFCGVKNHSGHIYTVLEDRGVGVGDLIADNGGYSHVYGNQTEGFWLPPGVYPTAR
jgi:hypothetical protein